MNSDGPHPVQIKKPPLHGPNNLFRFYRQKRYVPGQHGGLRFFVTPQTLLFHLVAIDIHNVVYLGGFQGTIEAQHLKEKFRPHLMDVADFRPFSSFPLSKFAVYFAAHFGRNF